MAELTNNNPQQSLADKETYYEQVTRTVRWIAIAIVIISFPPGHPQYHLLLIAAGVGAIFNGLRYWKRLLKWKLFASRITTLIADNALIGVLLGLSGGIHSPYFIFWALTLISAAYWYGRRGVGLVLAWQIADSLLITFYHAPVAPIDTLRVGIIGLGTLAALALLAERLTRVGQNERQVLASANSMAQTERERLVALVNSLVDPVVAIDSDGHVSVYNGAALDLLNTNKLLAGQAINEFLHLEDAKGVPVPLAAILGHEAVLKRNDLVMRMGDGSLVNLDVSVAPIHAQNIANQNYILIMRDITKQKTLDQERDEFISVTSHELRTPVAIAEANLSTALLPNYDTMGNKTRELITQAHHNVVFLGELIADLSTLSKAEQGRLKIEISTIDPAQLVQQLGEDYRASATARKLILETHVQSDLKPFHSSLNLIHEILQNFLTNAIKYTEKGSVRLSADLSESQDAVIFAVSDTGIGISASDKKKLFGKFYRSEDYRTRKTSGTGLGLYITLKLAERIHGKIWFKSRLNGGSSFFLEVPMQHPVQLSKDPAPAVSAALKQFVEG